MKKAFSKILLIFILAAILGAVYFIWQAIAAKKNQGPTVKAPDIQVIVQGDHKIVKNLTDGYQVTIPKTWTIDGTKRQFYSSLDPEVGCKISTQVNNEKIDIKDLKTELENNIKDEQLTVENLKFEEILVNDLPGIRETLKTLEWGDSIRIYVPVDNKLYGFVMSIPSLSIEKCTIYMNNFVNNIILR